MLGEDRGAFWFDLRLLELETDLSDGRALSASAGLRKLQMAARSRELLHIETRCALLRARALFEAGSSEALREMGRALSVCEREQYEQMTLEAASSAPELAGEAWAHGLSGEFLSRVFGRQPDRLWPPALRAARGSDKFPRLSALLADWGTPECIPLLQEWAARPGPSGRAAGRALEVARRRLGRRGAVPGSGVLDMRLLGPLEIRVRGERLSLRAFRTERAAQVFALLALRGKSGEDRERLLEMFWPRSPLAEARRNLSPTLSYIREAIRSGLPDMEPLDREEGRVRLSADLRLSWDLDAAAGFERAGTEGPEAHEKAEIFLDAWRGAFLEGWDAPWIETERRRLESLRRRASLLLASRDRQAGSLEAAERRLRAHLEGEPLDEEAHRELLETLARRGDFAQAWSEHRSFLERLARDAGGAPEPLTLSLVKRLRTIQKESAN